MGGYTPNAESINADREHNEEGVGMGNYPAGADDGDQHFDLPSGSGNTNGSRQVGPPLTTMVYCPPCMRHWETPAREDYWNARVELCPRHRKMADEGVTEEDVAATRVPTSFQDSER